MKNYDVTALGELLVDFTMNGMSTQQNLQRETLLGQQTTAPTCLGSRKQRKPFSPPALRSQ